VRRLEGVEEPRNRDLHRTEATVSNEGETDMIVSSIGSMNQ
jgi:hypothetical protein